MATATGKPSPPPTPPPNPNSKPPAQPPPTHPPKSSRIEASNKPSSCASLLLPPSPSPLLPMGHGASKPEPGMELRPGMKPIRLKIEEVKRRRRARKSSIVSTGELLPPEECEGMVDDDSARGATAIAVEEEENTRSLKTIADAAAEEKVKEEKRIDEEEKVATEAEEEEEEEKRELGFRGAEEDEDEKGRKLGSSSAYADLPGSPSFRFYCTDLARDWEDDSSVKFGGARRKDELLEMKKEKKMAHKRGDSTSSKNSNEYLEIKPFRRDKGRRLKALTKAPTFVYNLLNVRNCYNNPSSTTNQVTASLLSRTAAL